MSTGGDIGELKEINDYDKETILEEYAAHKRLLEMLYKFPGLLITAVNGYALGMGSNIVTPVI